MKKSGASSTASSQPSAGLPPSLTTPAAPRWAKHAAMDATGADANKAALRELLERDDIADCLRTWSRAVPFDMALAREHRQRKFFAERYDARHDVADWDYNMRLKDVAPIVRYQHFRSWRMGGVAYELRDARYEQPNRTLATWCRTKVGAGRPASRGPPVAAPSPAGQPGRSGGVARRAAVGDAPERAEDRLVEGAE